MTRQYCTYQEVMLDWAIAEAISPSKWPYYVSHVGDPLRARCAEECLSEMDRAVLVEAVEGVHRKSRLRPFGISRSATFWREDVPAEQVEGFPILPHFEDRYGAIPFGEFAAQIKAEPQPEEDEMQADAEKMLRFVRLRGNLAGAPIAITRGTKPPLLIEGYKRAMVALWSRSPSLDLYFCQPSKPLAGARDQDETSSGAAITKRQRR